MAKRFSKILYVKAMKDHPFQVGTRVAIQSGLNRDHYEECRVAKVYKTGHIVLENSEQRWRPYSQRPYGGDGSNRWYARPAGGGYHWSTVLLWDEATDKEIREAVEATARKCRWSALAERVSKLRGDDITDALCDAIEAALPKPK